MGRRRYVQFEGSKLMRVTGEAESICKELSGLRKTSTGETASYLLTKYGPAELRKALEGKIKSMNKKG